MIVATKPVPSNLGDVRAALQPLQNREPPYINFRTAPVKDLFSTFGGRISKPASSPRLDDPI
jgi:hypothetical protein